MSVEFTTDEPISSPEPSAAAVPASAPTSERSAAVKAWHAAKTDDERRAAVKQYPVLADIFTLAANLK